MDDAYSFRARCTSLSQDHVLQTDLPNKKTPLCLNCIDPNNSSAVQSTTRSHFGIIVVPSLDHTGVIEVLLMDYRENVLNIRILWVKGNQFPENTTKRCGLERSDGKTFRFR